MARIDPPLVARGQRVTLGLFEAMRRAVLACRLIAGPGVRLRHTSSGTVISFAAGGQGFVHPWLVGLLGTEAANIRPGTINRVPATIKGEPLDGGKAGNPAPRLDFGKPRLDAEGRGWICAECTFKPADAWSVAKVEIVQVADPDTADGAPLVGLPNATGGSLPLPGNRARHPLAMLRLRASGQLEVFQIAHFDLTHRVKLTADGVTAARHFFY